MIGCRWVSMKPGQQRATGEVYVVGTLRHRGAQRLPTRRRVADREDAVAGVASASARGRPGVEGDDLAPGVERRRRGLAQRERSSTTGAAVA